MAVHKELACEQEICEHPGSRSPTRPFQTGHDDRSVMSADGSFPMAEAYPEPRSSNRGTDDGLPPRGARWRHEPGRQSEKTSEDGGNLPDDDAETQSLGSELPVEEVVAGRIRFEDPRDDRPPSLQETLVGGMAGVEPMIEETLPLAGIGPEHPPVFEPSLVLVEQPSHEVDCRPEGCPGQGSSGDVGVRSGPAPWPKRHGHGRGAPRAAASGQEDRRPRARSTPAVRSLPKRPVRASWLGAHRAPTAAVG